MEASACSHEYFDPCFIESWTAMAFLRPFSDLGEHRLTAVNTEPITNYSISNVAQSIPHGLRLKALLAAGVTHIFAS